ncbi:MAG: hypothetical protein AB1767_09890 [Bacillota bacterium]
MILENLTGLLILGALTVSMLLVVPWEKIRQLAVFALLFGMLFPFAVIGIMQNLLGFWRYRGVDWVNLAGIPVFLALAWAPSVIIFAYLIIQYRSPLLRLLLLLAVGAGVAGIQFLHLLNNNLTFQNWTLTGSFFLAVIIHTGLLVVMHLMGYLQLPELLRN